MSISEKKIKIISVVGARPNFMKISPFINEINKFNSNSSMKVNHILVHTGQHYDDRMSKIFFKQLNIPDANINLGIGSGTHAEQVGNTMIAFEKILIQENPDWVVVVGDVNATLACTVTAKKLNINKLSLETGSGEFFAPARKLFDNCGFKPCPPFAHYKEDVNSLYFTKLLDNSYI